MIGGSTSAAASSFSSTAGSSSLLPLLAITVSLHEHESSFGLQFNDNMRVTEIEAGSPAARSGLRQLDLVLACDGEPISLASAGEHVRGKRKLELRVQRPRAEELCAVAVREGIEEWTRWEAAVVASATDDFDALSDALLGCADGDIQNRRLTGFEASAMGDAHGLDLEPGLSLSDVAQRHGHPSWLIGQCWGLASKLRELEGGTNSSPGRSDPRLSDGDSSSYRQSWADDDDALSISREDEDDSDSSNDPEEEEADLVEDLPIVDLSSLDIDMRDRPASASGATASQTVPAPARQPKPSKAKAKAKARSAAARDAVSEEGVEREVHQHL